MRYRNDSTAKYALTADVAKVTAIVAFVWFIAWLIWGGSIYIDFSAQNNRRELYLALRNDTIMTQDLPKNTTDKVFLAKTIQALRDKTFQDWQGLPGLIDKKEALKFALKQWNKTVSVMEQREIPLNETALGITLPAFETWRSAGLPGGFFLFSITLSIAYAYENKFQSQWWQYPWGKRWAYPLALFMMPYIVFVQIPVGIYAFYRITTGIDQREEEEARAAKRSVFLDELAEQKKSAERKITALQQKKEITGKLWVEFFKEEKRREMIDRIESNLKAERAELTRLGTSVEEKQRAVAGLETELKTVKRMANLLRRKSLDEIRDDFKKISSLAHVMALDVKDNWFFVYTDTLFVPYKGCTYEHGVAEICIPLFSDNTGSIKIRNLVNPSASGKHFQYSRTENYCFGELDDCIRDFMRERDYPALVVTIIQCLQSAEGDDSDRIRNWRRVS